MARRLLRLCLILLLLAPVAAAASLVGRGEDASAQPQASSVATPQDRSFIDLFMRASLAAAEAGDIASQRGQHPLVRHYGALLAEDFREAGRQLAILAGALDLPPLPVEPDGDQKAATDRLQRTGAPHFDLDYLAQQARAQDDLMRVIEIEIGTGDQAHVRRFAAAMLPRLREYRLQSRVLATLVRESSADPAASPPSTVTF